MVNPGGTGRPALVISARPEPFPPSVSRIVRSPSALPLPKKNTCFFARGAGFFTDAATLAVPFFAGAVTLAVPFFATRAIVATAFASAFTGLSVVFFAMLLIAPVLTLVIAVGL